MATVNITRGIKDLAEAEGCYVEYDTIEVEGDDLPAVTLSEECSDQIAVYLIEGNGSLKLHLKSDFLDLPVVINSTRELRRAVAEFVSVAG